MLNQLLLGVQAPKVVVLDFISFSSFFFVFLFFILNHADKSVSHKDMKLGQQHYYATLGRLDSPD